MLFLGFNSFPHESSRIQSYRAASQITGQFQSKLTLFSVECFIMIRRKLILSVIFLSLMVSGVNAAEPNLIAKRLLLGSSAYGYKTPYAFNFSWPDQASGSDRGYYRNLPSTKLEKIKFFVNSHSELFLNAFPEFKSVVGGQVLGVGPKQERVIFSIDPILQATAKKLVSQTKAPHVAVVLMQPKTGRILALANKSQSKKNLVLHSEFPAASLFKIITSAAALEKTALSGHSLIKFRGSNYTLNKWNYYPDRRKDTRAMTFEEALGKSCNAVFARIALQHLNSKVLEDYSKAFGFNSDLRFDTPLHESRANVPTNRYQLSRTAAGFGQVKLSPIHAATLVSAIGNNGLLPRPSVVDRIVDPYGRTIYRNQISYIKQAVKSRTASNLLNMLRSTITTGTSRTEFKSIKSSPLSGIPVAAKTGTLTGSNPRGLNKWFVAAAPSANPEIALAVIVVNPLNRYARASRLGRILLENYFKYKSRRS